LSAVDEEYGSGDEVCVRESEEDGRAGDLVGITDAADQERRPLLASPAGPTRACH